MIVAFGVVLLVPSGFLGLYVAASGGSNRGSPRLAAEWKAELSTYANPDEATAANPEVIVVRFRDSDQWVMGLTRSSHGMWKRGGGTMVVKDSTGAVRVFFGHVCGEGLLPSAYFGLSQFYDELKSTGMVEQALP